MPSKHIEQSLWEAVEKRTVEAVDYCQRPISTAEMLRFLIVQGLMHTDMEEIRLLKGMSSSTVEEAIAGGEIPVEIMEKYGLEYKKKEG